MSKSTSDARVKERLEICLTGIEGRPQMYAESAGELDTYFFSAYELWSVSVDRHADFHRALANAGDRHGIGAGRIISDQQRHEPVQLGSPATDAVVYFWLEVRHELGVPSRDPS